MTSSNLQAWNKKYIFLNNLESKHSLLMKYLMSYHKRIKIIKKFHKKCATWKLVPGPFEFAQN